MKIRMKSSWMAGLVIALMSCGGRAQSIEAMMNSGQELLRNGAASQAVAVFRKILSRDPQHFEAQHNLGFSYLMMGRNADAVRELKRAIDLNGRNAETWANIAVAYENLGQAQKALDALYQAVRLDPSNVDARMNLATMYFNADQMGSAIKQYKQVISLDGTNVEAYTYLAKCLLEQGKVSQAKKYLQQSLGADANNAEAHWELGNIYWKRENAPERALKEYRIAVNLEPNSHIYYQNLALLLEEQGKKEEAIDVWEKSLIYLDDALRKEKIRERIDVLRHGATAESDEAATPPSVSTEDQINQLRKDLRRKDESETKVMKTTPVDFSSDFEKLQEEEEEEEDVDLEEEMKNRVKKK
jgi:tetratricopeptide (TPR) repeat protein